MRIHAAVALVGACLHAVLAAAEPRARTDAALRLVKTSEGDPGQWVTEKQMFERFVSRKVGFLDITDRPEHARPRLASRQTTSFPRQVRHKDTAGRLISEVSVAKPQGWLQTLTNFHTRHHESPTGKQAATWLFNEAKSVASANPAINVTQFKHSWDQPSVIARIPGNSSSLVIVGAHFDSTGGSVQARSPGADDNGSGTVVVLEALRVFAKTGYRPQNTLEFHFYAAEEAGRRGSMNIFSNYKTAPANQSSLITDNVDSALTDFVRTVATAYMDKPPTNTKCGYACSDHASATEYGFPSSMLVGTEFENTSKTLHSSNDSLDKIQWPTVLRHAQFVVGFMVEASSVGNGGPTAARGPKNRTKKPKRGSR